VKSRPYLYTVVFVAGAVVLALEILAGRYLVPAFGNSLFIWAAVLSVTLLCLALGYRWGGLLADRSPAPEIRLRRHLLLAAGWIGAVPLWGAKFLLLGMVAGAAAGPPISVTVLFAVPITLLATVVPLAFGGVMQGDRDRPGQKFGDLFAVSTVGSVAGALAAGYLAVPLLGLSRSFFVLALLLVGVMLPGLLRGAGTTTGLVILGLLVLSYLLPPELRGAARLREGMEFVYRTATRYSQLDVVEDRHDGTRVLLLDGASQNWVGGEDWSESRFDYIGEILRHLDRYRVQRHRALVLGLGAGLLIRDLLTEGWGVEAVEIDPAVARVAAEHFSFPARRVRVHLEDGRAFLERAARSGSRFDLVVVDVTGGGHHPDHIYNLETYRLAKALLTEKGLLVLNLVVFTYPPRDRMALHTVATAARVFPQVEAVDLYPGNAQTGDLSELLIFASEVAPGEPFSSAYRGRLLPVDRTLRPLTDDWNPASLWSVPANTRWHQNMVRWLGEAAVVPH
jgi:spermidine synthase